jgi:parallel beta-helix repeat protein
MNTFYNNDRGLYIYYSSNNNSVLNNFFYNNRYGMILQSNNLTAINNTIINNTERGISLYYANNSVVSNNYIYNNELVGIFVNYANNNNISTNFIYNHSLHGIHTHESDYNIIMNNIITNGTEIVFSPWHGDYVSLGYGISLGNCSDYNLLLNNTINLYHFGIVLKNEHNNTIKDNHIFNNTQNGLYAENSSSNFISRNIFANNDDYGIYLNVSSDNNVIVFNNLIDNHLGGTQAYDIGSNNNYSYNYWNEWTEPDFEGNFIVDDPYVIDGGTNQDDFPLIKRTDTISPVIESPLDIVIYEDSVGYSILWVTTAFPPANYTVYRNNTDIANGTVIGSVIVWLDGLSPGKYNFTCLIIDKFGFNAKDEVWVTIIQSVPDTDPPLITSPPDVIFEEGSIGYSIIWSGSDDHPWWATVTQNNTIIYNHSWIGNDIEILLENLSVGLYIYNCTLFDETGNSIPDIVIVTVLEQVPDTDPPDIISSEPIEYEEGTDGHFLTWNCSDAHPYAYRIYINNTEMIFSPWHGENITFNVDGLSTGLWLVNLTLWDLSGNNNSSVVYVTVVPPAPDLTPPIISQPVDIIIAENMSAIIVWEVSDDHPGLYIIFQNNSQLFEPDTWMSGIIQYPFASLPVGTWEFNLTIWDQTGNSASSVVKVIVIPLSAYDTDPPQISSVDNQTIAFGSNNNIIVFLIFDQHPQGYSIYLNEIKTTENVWITPNTHVNVSLDGLNIGDYLLNITAWDLWGNSASQIVLISVIGDNQPPTISSPPDTITYEEKNASLIWEVSDLFPSKFEIKILPDEQLIQSGSWSGENIEVDLSTFTEGEYTIRCIVYDTSGNYGFDDVIVTVEGKPSDGGINGFDYSMIIVLFLFLTITRNRYNKKRRLK